MSSPTAHILMMWPGIIHVYAKALRSWCGWYAKIQ